MTASEPSRFSDWVRAQLKARRMTHRQLAERAGVHHSTISRVLSGRTSPSLTTAVRLLGALGVQGEPALAGQLYGRGGRRLHPTALVESALRSDEALGARQVREVMSLYLELRRRNAEARGAGPSGPAPDRPGRLTDARPVSRPSGPRAR
jgi:transcriptional regulator with XRE-family HTH domain